WHRGRPEGVVPLVPPGTWPARARVPSRRQRVRGPADSAGAGGGVRHARVPQRDPRPDVHHAHDAHARVPGAEPGGAGAAELHVGVRRRGHRRRDRHRHLPGPPVLQRRRHAAAAGQVEGALRLQRHLAPWMLTVAASTMDRSIRSTVQLGNGAYFHGESLYQPNVGFCPLVYAGASGKPFAEFCGNGSLDGFDVKGKI
uniref:Uncharacterized protein n=1 Tax=Aegilops tauschii subsp. strangulata TaxID=200361 RepID=A0A453CNL7_AEGTS